MDPERAVFDEDSGLVENEDVIKDVDDENKEGLNELVWFLVTLVVKDVTVVIEGVRVKELDAERAAEDETLEEVACEVVNSLNEAEERGTVWSITDVYVPICIVPSVDV